MIRKLPIKTRILWQIRISLLFLILIAAVLAFVPLTIWMLVPSAALLALALVFLFWYVPAFFGSYEIIIEDNTVIINRGVFIKTSHILPFPRLVFAQSIATPFSLRLGLTAITLKAARGMILIPEMYTSDAKALISEISGEEYDEA